MEKIRCRCRTCVHEVNARCVFKNEKVKVNKVRWCATFVRSKEKVQARIDNLKPAPKTVMRPDSYWDKSKKQPYIGDLTDSDLFSVGSANSETTAGVNMVHADMTQPDCLAGLRKQLETEDEADV